MLHIDRFIDRIKKYEASNNKDFLMSMRDAKDLHSDITKMLSAYYDLTAKVEVASTDNEIHDVIIDGGTFGD